MTLIVICDITNSCTHMEARFSYLKNILKKCFMPEYLTVP